MFHSKKLAVSYWSLRGLSALLKYISKKNLHLDCLSLEGSVGWFWFKLILGFIANKIPLASSKAHPVKTVFNSQIRILFLSLLYFSLSFTNERALSVVYCDTSWSTFCVFFWYLILNRQMKTKGFQSLAHSPIFKQTQIHTQEKQVGF